MNLYAYAGNNPVRFRDPFGLDTVEVVSPALKKVVDAKRDKDVVFDSVYTALDQDPRTFRLIGTDVVPGHPLNSPAARFTVKTFGRDDEWAGFEEYLGFTDERDVGVAVIGMNGPHPGETTGHEMGHLLQVKDAKPFSHDDAIMIRIIQHFGY